MTDAAKDRSESQGRLPVLRVACLGAVLLWLSQPPVAWWWLGWLAPVPWLLLSVNTTPFGRSEYLRVWCGGILYWGLALYWVCFPHPLTPLGLPPLAMYLGCYAVALVALVRAARRRWRVPLWLAAPVVWTGLELVQARLFSGFLMGAVSHAQVGQPWVRSIAAYAGAYGVTFAVLLAAATCVEAARLWRGGARLPALLAPLVAIGAVLAAGWAARSTTPIERPDSAPTRVALIQGYEPATWDPDPNRSKRIMDRHTALTAEAARASRVAGQPLDLVVWPESMFREPLFTFDGSRTPPPKMDDRFLQRIEATEGWLRYLTETAGAAVVVGIDRFDWPANATAESSPRLYNSVAIAGRDGVVGAVYDKTHLVPFGEYIPLADGLPALYYLTPMSGGLGTGDGPVAMRATRSDGETLVLCPSICYETVIPHLIRRQVAELTDRGDRPDALVNVTNDAWFWGASELDMHLACDIYRAIETGTPMLVAANGGLSAVIDARGEVVTIGPRTEEHVLLSDVPPRTADLTFYTRYGDVLAGACLLLTVLMAVSASWAGRRGSLGRPLDQPPPVAD